MDREPRHRFDTRTDFCLACGCSALDAVSGRACSPQNVVAVSHIIASRRWAAIQAEVMARLIQCGDHG